MGMLTTSYAHATTVRPDLAALVRRGLAVLGYYARATAR